MSENEWSLAARPRPPCPCPPLHPIPSHPADTGQGVCDQYCNVPGWAADGRVQYSQHVCRLSSLPDLRTENATVREMLHNWIRYMVGTYQ